MVLNDPRSVRFFSMGFLPIHEGVSEEKAKKVFGYTEIKFWPVRMEMPPKA